MTRELRIAGKRQVDALKAAISHVKEARECLYTARCPRSIAKADSLLKSLDGARRHMNRRLAYTARLYGHERQLVLAGGLATNQERTP